MKKIKTCFATFILFSLLLSSCTEPALPLAEKVKLDSYMGKWFEIAALPAGIKKGCTCTAFDYKLSSDHDYVMIINSCIKKGKQGAVLAKGFVDVKSAGAKWEIQLFWPFTEDYCIIALADDYSYAMAGHPDRKKLWIMSRNPVMDSATYNLLVERAQILGFDTTQLIKTSRDCNMR
jgi:apolipoprotein D and lipocalin family protein